MWCIVNFSWKLLDVFTEFKLCPPASVNFYSKTHFYILFEKFFPQKLVYIRIIFSYNNHVLIGNEKTKIIADA